MNHTPSTTNDDISLDISIIITCPICLTDYQTSEVISGCSQKHYFCKACFTQYLEHLISESQVTNITCPQYGCLETIEATFIELLVSAPLFEKYKTKLQRLQDKTQIKCPKPDCLISNMIDANKEFTVCQCGTQICNKCHNYWHKKENSLQDITEESGEFSKEIRTILCIKCNSIVTKIGGCPCMTCSVCKYDRCLDCGEQYLPGHWETCSKAWIPIEKTARQIFREKVISFVFTCLICVFLVLIPFIGLVFVFIFGILLDRH